MEHVTIIELDNGMVKLIPDKDYKLRNKFTDRYYSVAEINRVDMKWFEAVPIEVSSDEVEE